MSRRGIRAVLAALALAAHPGGAGAATARFETVPAAVAGASFGLRIPRGYRIELLSGALARPRMITFGPDGAIYAGSGAGRVYRVPPPYTRPTVLLDLAGYPHSVAFRPGEILIARTDGVLHAPWHAGMEHLDAAALRLLARVPGGGGHSSRTVAVGPDGRVYLSLGITGNCSDQYLGAGYPFVDRRGGVMVLDERTTPPHFVPFVSGLRNPVGFDWQPTTGVMYLANNGPDHLGFDQPPEVFERAVAGSFFGMPWYQFDGERMRRDSCIDSEPPRTDPTPPVATFPARNAPLGVAFVPHGALDARFEGDAVVALHGSWGTRPNGGAWGDPATRRPPKLVVVRFDHGRAVRVDDLVTGFQTADGARHARPVGLAFGPDGALYFTSDDGTEGLYRLRPSP